MKSLIVKLILGAICILLIQFVSANSTANVPINKMTYLCAPIYNGPIVVDEWEAHDLDVKNNYINLSSTIIKTYEFFSPTRYQDTKATAIGYGYTGKEYIKNHISKLKAEMMLIDHIIELNEFIDNMVIVELAPNQKATLISFVYNVGITAFRNSTLRVELNKGNYDKVPYELMKWIYITKNNKKVILAGLEARRNAEALLWNTSS